jgi:sugar lactone lactonase YvrE
MKLLRTLAVSAFTASLLAACGGPADVPSFTLPGERFYPESLTVSSDGTLFVGSLGTGQVSKFAPGATTPTAFVAAGGEVKNVSGVFADDATSTLYLCAVDLSNLGAPPSIRAYDLKSGAAKGSYVFPSSAFCNDMTVDSKGNLYATDSFGKIFRLPKGGSALSVWSSDALLAPSSESGFGADGIAFDGQGNLYVNTYSDGRLLRLPINADGSAGAAKQLTVSQAISLPDGMRMLDANTLITVEGTGKLTKLALSGDSATVTVLDSTLDSPTSVVKYGNNYYVTEGQLGHLFGFESGPPTTPFSVKRVAAR